MTREEARNRLLNYSRFIVEGTDLWEALDMAIEALKGDAESATTTHGRLIDADALMEDIRQKCLANNTAMNIATGKALTVYLLEAPTIVPATPKSATTTDCISRQEAVEAVAPFDTNHELRDTLDNLPPVTPTEQNEEDILKFYYVESLDEYWIGQRCRTMYYGKWTGNCFTYMYSRYLPWGEHVVAPDTLWKEYTYPSEPKEIPFNEWLQGFLEKKYQTERTGEWVSLFDGNEWFIHCSKCKTQHYEEDLLMGGSELPDYCPNCGADMRGNKE